MTSILIRFDDGSSVEFHNTDLRLSDIQLKETSNSCYFLRLPYIHVMPTKANGAVFTTREARKTVPASTPGWEAAMSRAELYKRHNRWASIQVYKNRETGTWLIGSAVAI